MFSGVSLQSLLTFNPSLFNDGYQSLTDDPPLPSLPESITVDITPKLLIPKTEHHIDILPPIEQTELLYPQQPFNFFPTYHHQPFDNFHRLPQLRSPEPSFSNRKRLHHHLTIETAPPPPPPPPSARGKAISVIPQSHLARQRRQKLSEKTRCLQKLMPWDKKMDQATLLEEAYKYVKFLQAQFSALQSMPSNCNSHFHNGGTGNGGVFGDLERLNRNQVLQVLVNSPVAQTMLYSRGSCVFSIEQLSLLRKLSERKQQLQNQQQQQMSDYGSSKTFFD